MCRLWHFPETLSLTHVKRVLRVLSGSLVSEETLWQGDVSFAEQREQNNCDRDYMKFGGMSSFLTSSGNSAIIKSVICKIYGFYERVQNF